MATDHRALRRGLPRVAGGEPWPPADRLPPAGVADAAASAVDVFAGGVAVDEAAAGVAVAGVSVADAAAAPVAGVAEVSYSVSAGDAVPPPHASVASSPSGGGRMRRGLPRTRGGEPWPPAVERVDLAVVPGPVAQPDAAQTTAVSAAAPEASQSPVAPSPASAVSSLAGAALASEGSAPAGITSAGPGVRVRRGLPRSPGAEPWPSAAFVAAAAAVSGARAEAASVAPAQESGPTTPVPQPDVATGTPGRRARTGLPRPGIAPAAAPPPAAAPALMPSPAPAAAAPASAPGAPAPASAPALPPLPFVPTVFLTPNAARWNAERESRKAPIQPPHPRRHGPFTAGQWAGAIVVGGAALLFAAAMVVLLARWFVSLAFMRDFMAAFPGQYHLPVGAPVGFPAWVGWQHFFNVFLMVLIIRSGWRVRREKRPTVFWSPRSNAKRKISLTLWLHQSLDILWLVNGAVFVVLLFVTGQWLRIIPTSWEVFPNALTAALKYVSLDWPTEDGWVNYNALQQLAYFATVFLAAPLAAITGVRMSGVWPRDAKRLNRVYPVEWARAVHFPVMIYFVLFIIVHVALVLATGALRNLNHMYGGSDVVNWVGFWIFVASLAVIAAAWVAVRPLILAPIARLFGAVSGR